MILPNLPISAFQIKTDDEWISLTIEEVWGFPNETCWPGGYSTKGILHISCGNCPGKYEYKGTLYFTTGEVYTFYQELKNCYEALDGSAELNLSEHDFYLNIGFDKFGHVICKGWLKALSSLENKLNFEIHTDQTFLIPAIEDMKVVVDCFGGMEGLKNTR